MSRLRTTRTSATSHPSFTNSPTTSSCGHSYGKFPTNAVNGGSDGIGIFGRCGRDDSATPPPPPTGPGPGPSAAALAFAAGASGCGVGRVVVAPTGPNMDSYALAGRVDVGDVPAAFPKIGGEDPNEYDGAACAAPPTPPPKLNAPIPGGGAI